MADHRLLIIEDDPKIADLVASVAGEMEFETRTASGLGALEAYDHFKPHCIVLDILMPEMDGLEVLQALKERVSEARIIILSGGENSYRRMAEHLGEAGGLVIAANIAKPFRLNEMRSALEKIRARPQTETMPSEKAG